MGPKAPEKGLTAVTTDLPAATVGRPYRQQLEAWGGSKPYRRRLLRRRLPPGLKLAADGTVTGRPRRAGRWSFDVEVTDASVSPATGREQSYIQRVRLTVGSLG